MLAVGHVVLAALPLLAAISVVDQSRRACPDGRAVAARLVSPDDSRAWQLRYGSDREGVTLQLLLDGDDVRLERRIAAADDDCTARAEAIAIVVERYFTSLGIPTRVPTVSAAPP